MIGSLLIKLAMLALTMGAILWIGWTVPPEGIVEPELVEKGHTLNVQRAEASPALPTAAATIPASRTTEQPQGSPKSRPDKLDLNRATEQDFESLPGIGPVLAGRIMEYRQGMGSFRRIEDLREVKGIGKKKFDRIRNLVHVTIPMQPPREGKKTT